MSPMVPAPASARSMRRERRVDRGQVGLADPAQEHVLLDGRAHRVAGEAARDVGERAPLLGRQVAERQRDDRHHVARLALRDDVRLAPAREARRVRPGGQRARRADAASRRWRAGRPGTPSSADRGAAWRAPRARGAWSLRCPSFLTTNLKPRARAVLRARRGARRRGSWPARSAGALPRAGTRRRAAPLAARRRGRRPRTSSKPRFTSRRRRRACARWRPRSWKFVRPHALSLQPENATLNLRPKSCVSSWPSRKNVMRVRVRRHVERLVVADARVAGTP